MNSKNAIFQEGVFIKKYGKICELPIDKPGNWEYDSSAISGG